jgi:ankyrin repeat protein
MTDQEKAFIESCIKGDLKSIKTCINYNVDVNIENSWGIEVAARNNHSMIVKHLLENGVTNQAAANKKILAQSINHNNLELANYLINRSEEYKNDTMALQWAATNGNIEAITLLLPYIKDLRWVYCYAAKNGHIDLIHYLNDNNIYNYDSAIDLVLNWAAHGRKWNIITLLVKENIVNYETLVKKERIKYEDWMLACS